MLFTVGYLCKLLIKIKLHSQVEMSLLGKNEITNDYMEMTKMNTFKLHGIELGVEYVFLNISEEGLLLNLEVEADEKFCDEIKANENHIWKTLVFLPLIYFYDVNFSLDEKIVISPFHNKEIALNMWEHWDFCGTLTVTEEHIEIEGIVEGNLPEAPYQLEIWIDRKSSVVEEKALLDSGL